MAANVHEPPLYAKSNGQDRGQLASESLLLTETDVADTPQQQHADGLVEVSQQFTTADGSGQSPGFLSLLYTRWLVELLACFVAVLALAAIVITLGTHNGRPLPKWPFEISVNALVSIFSVILKGAMMVPVAEAISQLKWSWYKKARPLNDLASFDRASRGVWGSARLIQRLRGMHLASLGALVTVLAVASDPFIQQVIKYHPCAQAVNNGTALFSRTNNYTKSGIHTGAGFESLDLAMQAAIFDGVYDSYSPVAPACSTGNCTFPDYRTVGMCSVCQDISSQINTTCNTSTIEGGYDCIWRLPSGLNLSIPNPVAMAVSTDTDSIANTAAVSTSQIVSFTTVLDYNKDHLINWTMGLANVMGLECALYPCVRTYSSGVIGGQPFEVILSTDGMTKPSSDPFDGFEASPMPCLINGTYYDAISFTKQNSTNSVPVTGLLKNNQTAYLPKECYFTYANPLGLEQYIPEFLAGFVVSAPEDDTADPAWMGQLYKNGGATLETVNATWAALAESMTVLIRQAGDASNSAPATGEAWRTETCISVQWPWLTFPIVMLAMSLAFLLATIVQSARRVRGQIWKASPLALLFHGLDHDLSEKFRFVDQADEMEYMAKRVLVKVGHEDGGLRFVEAFQEKA